jgi:hypothetical protein
MAESEVENILREIRERVIAQERAAAHPAANRSNGNGSLEPEVEIARSSARTSENFALINSYLTTMGRAWDRLPPVVSNRSGALARLELWMKRHLKRATRWYAWEQVNFNAAVYHALKELPPIITAYEDELRRLQRRIAVLETELKAVEESQIEATGKVSEKLSEQIAMQALAQTNALQNEAAERRKAINTQRIECDQKFSAVTGELRESVRSVQEEQRVCFKQLSLESSEAAVLEDRARRKFEAALEELRAKIDRT